MSAVEDQAATLREKHGECWQILVRAPLVRRWLHLVALASNGDDLRNVVHADTAEHLDEHIRLREEDLAADAALSDEAARDLDGDDLSP